MKRCFQDMKWPAAVGAGFSVRSVLRLAGAVFLWHALQSWVCLIKVRPDHLLRSLPICAVLLSQINSKRNLPKLTCSLEVHYLFSGLERGRESLFGPWPLLPDKVASVPVGADALPLTCFFAWELLRIQIFISSLHYAESWSLRMDQTTKGIRNSH